MASQSYYELYRGSSLGLALTDTLDDLINEGRIEPQLAMKILTTFDKVVTEVLAEKVRARLTFKVHSFRGRSHPRHKISSVAGDQA
ncbi:uncharacterized protein N7482_006764 [Penicillium canariense]|uniref:Transcription initiation factor IIA subunit 2 n=1 Tax=Penicillium canariense TaxID=189055 RepID=A0A9W9I0A0_9EURO|nr:uncharacterized protein N7482_006764 [Penicillium canariense]KAJ5159760.1 hypothetical protein N7482_006764 [Penicillium canariense]